MKNEFSLSNRISTANKTTASCLLLQDETFSRAYQRWQDLKRWYELGDAPPVAEDKDLVDGLSSKQQLQLLRSRCESCRIEMNQVLPQLESSYETDLIVKTSQIENSGQGLFFEPQIDRNIRLPKSALICYYYGHLHDFHSSTTTKTLQDKSYLMLVQGDILVDPGPCPYVKARYINDPLDENVVNCRFVPQQLYSAVITTRDIQPGEELFVSYGDAYWASQTTTVGRPFRPVTS